MLWASGLKFLLFTQQPSTCVGQSEYSIFNIYNWSMLVACYSTSKVDGPPFIKWSMVWSQWQSISWHVMASRSAIAIVHGMPRQRWSKVLRRHYFAHYFWEITQKKNHILTDHPQSKDEISLPRGTHLCKQGEQLPLLVDSRVSWRGQADQDQTWIGGCSLCLLWRGVGQIIQGV